MASALPPLPWLSVREPTRTAADSGGARLPGAASAAVVDRAVTMVTATNANPKRRAVLSALCKFSSVAAADELHVGFCFKYAYITNPGFALPSLTFLDKLIFAVLALVSAGA